MLELYKHFGLGHTDILSAAFNGTKVPCKKFESTRGMTKIPGTSISCSAYRESDTCIVFKFNEKEIKIPEEVNPNADFSLYIRSYNIDIAHYDLGIFTPASKYGISLSNLNPTGILDLSFVD